MKKILTKEKTNSLYKKTLFVGIIALTLFNLSNANAENMQNREERDNMPRERFENKDKKENGKMGINNPLERGQKDTIGTITTINGNVITIKETLRDPRNSSSTPATKIYTVDASNAKIVKSGATTSISSLVVGDKISVVGSINGINITAKVIREEKEKLKDMDLGDGKPVVQGKITSINGNLVYITNNSNVSYVVDASNAKILINNSTNTIASLKVNDEIMVQGTINGTNVSATNIITHQDKSNRPNVEDNKGGFFQKTKGFFKKLFGF